MVFSLAALLPLIFLPENDSSATNLFFSRRTSNEENAIHESSTRGLQLVEGRAGEDIDIFEEELGTDNMARITGSRYREPRLSGVWSNAKVNKKYNGNEGCFYGATYRAANLVACKSVCEKELGCNAINFIPGQTCELFNCSANVPEPSQPSIGSSAYAIVNDISYIPQWGEEYMYKEVGTKVTHNGDVYVSQNIVGDGTYADIIKGQIPSTAESTYWKSVKNIGKECWSNRDARCQDNGVCDWCGSGTCCRKSTENKSWKDNKCSGSEGGDIRHECVIPGDKELFTPWDRTKIYGNGDKVGDKGKVYLSQTENNVDRTPGQEPTFWIEAWNPATTYNEDDQVLYLNRVYVSQQVGNRVNVPTADNEFYWKEVPAWTHSMTYNKDDKVTYLGKIYVSQKNDNRSRFPDQDDGSNWVEAWQSSPTRTYTQGDKVVYGDKIYVNQKPNADGQIMPSMPDGSNWVEAWEPDVSYGKYHKVAHNGKIYVSNTGNENLNQEPSATSAYWTEVPAFVSNKMYNKDDKMAYEGKIYVSQKDNNSGINPSMDDGSSWVEAWDPLTEYAIGQTVAHDGKTYVRQSRDGDVKPEPSANSPYWTEVDQDTPAEPAAWNPTTSYDKDDLVTHDNKIYVSQKGVDNTDKDPSTNGAYWTEAWNSYKEYVVGDKVSHDGINYFCKKGHKSVIPQTENTEYWEKEIKLVNAKFLTDELVPSTEAQNVDVELTFDGPVDVPEGTEIKFFRRLIGGEYQEETAICNSASGVTTVICTCNIPQIGALEAGQESL